MYFYDNKDKAIKHFGITFVYLIGVDHIKNRISLQHHLCIQHSVVAK